MKEKTMTQSTIGGFFSSGAKGITWPEDPHTPGGRTQVTGTIAAVHPPEPITDPATNQPVHPPREQIRIILDTTERDPDIDDDDGRRTLYVKSFMRGAIADALRKAGAKEPEPGATLTVTFTHITPPDRPGLSPSKRYSAHYTPPAVTGNFFNGNTAAPAAATVAPPTAAAPAAPAKPDSIDQRAWDAMDPTTKAAVAATMAQLPPF